MCVGCPGRVGKGVSPACVVPSPCPPVSQRAGSASVCQRFIGLEDVSRASAHEKRKVCLVSQGMAQRWSGRKQNLIENACKPCMCYLVPAPWGLGHRDSCAHPCPLLGILGSLDCTAPPGVCCSMKLHAFLACSRAIQDLVQPCNAKLEHPRCLGWDIYSLVIPGNEELLVLPEQHQTNQKSELQVQSIPEEVISTWTFQGTISSVCL